MSNSVKKKFEEQLERITQIIFRTNQSLSIIQYLTKVDSDSDVDFVKGKNPFLFFAQVGFWQMTVLDLSKLFVDSDNEKFNLNKFLKKLKSNGHYREMKFSSELVNNWLNKINESSTLINHLKDQRDKTYAHEDVETVPNSASVKETTKLFELALEIVYKLHLLHFKQELTFIEVGTPIKSLEEIIRMLSAKRTEELAPLREQAEMYGLNDKI